ncbi:MAG: peptidoglycan-binding domain-containing protein [Calothrix sp. MO_167.B42]|nr:peptidoglycan-binding domain-containing protein [Calothrix sp. MO_167.B42]
MQEYLIQGLLGVYPDPETQPQPLEEGDVCTSTGYVAAGVGYRIEVWDKDNRFDDRLGQGRTTALKTENLGNISITWGEGSYFEIRFADESLRQESGETETLENAEIFFKVFKGSQPIFSTEDNYLDLGTLPTDETISTSNPADDGYCYKMLVLASVIETEEEEERPTYPIPIPRDKVVDILPTADQIYNLGRQSTVTNTNSSLGGSLKQVVDNAFGRVIGQTFRAGNITNFRDSLNQTFAIQETNGQRTITYSPRSYTTQPELGGAITGAQASLYHRAKAALKEMLPLLDGIYELDPASDEQNRDAIRAVVRTEITEVVNEMGVQQGPRVQRVDSLFQLLIGTETESRLPEQIGGQLKDFARAFGLERSKINTVDEERNYGNFLIIRDYIVSLRQSWQDYVSLQMAGGGSFIGTQLVLLSQALSVMAESVRETYRIMDLVFLGPEERESVLIDFTQARDTELQKPRAKNRRRREYIKWVQTSLNNIFSRDRRNVTLLRVDGILGRLTREAIKRFQERRRIIVDGIVGPETERELIELTGTQPPIIMEEIAFLLPDGTPYYVGETAQLLPAMEVERLLSWVMRFATEEGPTLARSGGKLGIAKAIAKTSKTLMILLQASSYVPVLNNAFRREGVKRALRDLAFQTYRVKQLADELIPPLLSGEGDDVSDRFLRSANNFQNNNFVR